MHSNSRSARRALISCAVILAAALIIVLVQSRRPSRQQERSTAEIAQRQGQEDGPRTRAADKINSAIPRTSIDATHQDSEDPVASEKMHSESHDQHLDEFLEQASRVRFANAGQQKESFEFLWTPGLMLKEMLQETPIVVYPNE